MESPTATPPPPPPYSLLLEINVGPDLLELSGYEQDGVHAEDEAEDALDDDVDRQRGELLLRQPQVRPV